MVVWRGWVVASLFWRGIRFIGRCCFFRARAGVVGFFLILSPTHGYPIFQQLGGFLSFIYLLCAAVRLARFNVITNPLVRRDAKDSSKDFLGLPVPAAAGTVASLVLALLSLAESDRDIHRWAVILPPLLVLIAVLMVSTVRYPSGKKLIYKPARDLPRLS